jgi:phosphatidylglycerol:prolipoprotein diacylglycerol transferase
MLRGDSPRYLFHWTAAQWTAAIVIVISVLAGIYLTYADKKKEKIGQ